MIRKKTLQLLLCDYQRAARYHTIYRTFKQWSSDDFTTILRLFQKLLRLFQPGRYDYCWPLLAIGRQPEKRCGGSRQWFRAARRALAAGLLRRADHAQVETLTRRRWHGLRYAVPLHPLIYLIIIGGCADLHSVPAWRWYLVSVEGVWARVCPPTWHRWYYSRFCRSGIVGG